MYMCGGLIVKVLFFLCGACVFFVSLVYVGAWFLIVFWLASHIRALWCVLCSGLLDS